MQEYHLTRARNVRVYENGYAFFASDDEALTTCSQAHLGEVVDYYGKKVKLEDEEEAESQMSDVCWNIEKVKTKNGEKLTYEDVTHGFDVLRDGYVTTAMLLELLTQMSELDLDWPLDRRELRSLCDKARVIRAQLEHQNSYE